MRLALVSPLSTLIVATRAGNTAQAQNALSAFLSASQGILPQIERDTSKQANALHSAITNVRSHPSDLSALEGDRQALIAAIP